jgi:uncharacterized membrane protein YeaQ/YmgE (transglycosylase-associated protein family)
MWLLISLIIGLVAGVLAKAIMPGTRNEPSGWLMTILLGVGGGFIGGLLGMGSGNIVYQIIFSTIGAVILIALMRFFTRTA